MTSAYVREQNMDQTKPNKNPSLGSDYRTEVIRRVVGRGGDQSVEESYGL